MGLIDPVTCITWFSGDVDVVASFGAIVGGRNLGRRCGERRFNST